MENIGDVVVIAAAIERAVPVTLPRMRTVCTDRRRLTRMPFYPTSERGAVKRLTYLQD